MKQEECESDASPTAIAQARMSVKGLGLKSQFDRFRPAAMTITRIVVP